MTSNPPEKLAILLMGGSRDRLVAAVNLAASAHALGREVSLFFSWEALLHLARGALHEAPLPAGLSPLADRIEATQAEQTPLDELLQDLRQGGVKVYACSNTLPTLGIPPEDLEGKVDGISGATAFLALCEGAQVFCL